MSTVISAKDIENILAKGGDVKSLPADAILTPSARDLLRDLNRHSPAAAPAAASVAAGPATAPTKLLNSKSPQAELEAF